MKSLKRKFHYEKLDSTSTFLKCRRFSLRNFTFVSCDYQTDGHGRLGRTWHSNPKENLLFSLLIKDEKLIKNFSSLSICSAVSILKVLKNYNIDNLSFKWPNDVYVDGKKVCGILLESVSDNGKLSNLIIGIGINVNSKQFNGEYIVPPTSMCLQLSKDISIDKLKKQVYRQLKKEFYLLKKGNKEYLKIAREHNFLKDKQVYAKINDKLCKIFVKDIADNNALIYEEDGIENQIFSGEVTFHI